MASETLRQRVGRLLSTTDHLPDTNASRNEDQAYSLILCGDVFINGERCREPQRRVKAEDFVSVTYTAGQASGDGGAERWVSRAAVKLLGALNHFEVPVKDLVWIDVGCSTGGFTQVLLRGGASRVHAIDVGYNVLDYSLRNDPRVIVHERTNARTLSLDQLVPPADALVADLSFRSLRGICSHLLSLCKLRFGIVLIKPQFEFAATRTPGAKDDSQKHADSMQVGFDGVLDPQLEQKVVLEVALDLAEEGVALTGLVPSQRKGRQGNQEYLALVKLGIDKPNLAQIDEIRTQTTRIVQSCFSAPAGSTD